MADVTMNSPTIPNITPEATDLLLAWDASAAANGEFPISALNAIYAALASAVSFTAVTATASITVSQFDGGTGIGPVIRVQRNTSATTPSPGYINFVRPDGAHGSIYVTDDGLLRILAGFTINNSNMASGVVVGTQSSNLAEKDVLPGLSPIDEVLAAIAEGAEAVRRFVYKPPMNWDTGERQGDRPMGGQVFEGVIIDYSERYGMDKDEANPEGRSLNTINATGDLLRAVAWLVEQNTALTARVAALEGA